VLARILVLAALLGSTTALACTLTCTDRPLEDDFTVATWVFEGVVTRANEDTGEAEIEVMRVWKGNPPSRIVLVNPVPSCHAVIAAGGRRLIFLPLNPNSLDYSCARHPLVDSQEGRSALSWLAGRARSVDAGPSSR